MNWIIGFLVSIVVGHAVVWTVHHLTYKYLSVSGEPGPGLPASVLGIGERAFFTLVIAFNIAGAPIAMIGWIALKMGTGWQQLVAAAKEDRGLLTRQAFGALFVNLWSMGFALFGGLICNEKIPITWITKFVGDH